MLNVAIESLNAPQLDTEKTVAVFVTIVGLSMASTALARVALVFRAASLEGGDYY